MTLPDLKQLRKIIALCRKTGVQSIEIDGVKITLNDEAPTRAAKPAKTSGATETPDAPFETDTLTDEQLLFFSSGGGVGIDDPTKGN